MKTSAVDRSIELFLARNIRDGSRVLDVGCGSGWASLAVARRRPGCAVTAIDRDLRAVRETERLVRKNGYGAAVRCTVGEAERLRETFERNTFECAVAVNAFHHFRDPRRVLKGIRAVLKPRGTLLLSELTADYGGRHDECPRYSAEQLLWFMTESGFRAITAAVQPPGIILLRSRKKPG